jgi:DNA-binding transcriptional regulator LsrR (DeoR family)
MPGGKHKPHGWPRTAAKHADEVHRLFNQGLNKAEIAQRFGIGRRSVIRIIS